MAAALRISALSAWLLLGLALGHPSFLVMDHAEAEAPLLGMRRAAAHSALRGTEEVNLRQDQPVPVEADPAPMSPEPVQPEISGPMRPVPIGEPEEPFVPVPVNDGPRPQVVPNEMAPPRRLR
mmetsp:Transcript_64417/g.171852  ORF Transcript_64417/g.171852 Transcript_64417/m.171852 type:complete len:123 (-) Transcript_64417:65-433(-)|eukprot:CAMPEP_0171218762 /NCGR_PEP_ID=MMETSP0790-20130122/33367_1 /TAXON_ID=2925 /ORGANISM="Alexandrium catenella, Strain OF101" /LENGTH=122 /DNA_ID=CAMNT_0011684591 /DNA_START=65 /DNA_END=433 /DNA_ORIENTATION=+